MKKIFCILFSFTVLFTLAFADKSRFYEDGKVIDTMYVDSEDGLKVRDYPSLKSKRLCGLSHRFPVKVVAIGKEETIDEITAPWVEILIPQNEWKGNNPEYGWVFCGYLAKKLPEFKKPETASQFKQYLEDSYWRFWWEDGDGAMIRFGYFENGSIYLFENSHDFESFQRRYERHPKYGNIFRLTDYWTVSGNAIKTTGASFVGRISPYSSKEVEQFLFVSGKTNFEVTETGLSAGIHNNDYREMEQFVWYDFHADKVFLRTEKIMGEHYYFDTNMMLHNKRLYYLDYDGKNVLQNLEDEAKLDEGFASECIKAGISAKGTKYEQRYHDYRNPIMAEQQKKADKIK